MTHATILRNALIANKRIEPHAYEIKPITLAGTVIIALIGSEVVFRTPQGKRSSRNRKRCARMPIVRPPSLLIGTMAWGPTCPAPATYANPGFIVAFSRLILGEART